MFGVKTAQFPMFLLRFSHSSSTAPSSDIQRKFQGFWSICTILITTQQLLTVARCGGCTARKSGRRGRGGQVAATADRTAENALDDDFRQVEHVPTVVERSADPAKLAAFHEMFDSRAQVLINILPAFDAYTLMVLAFEASIPLLCNYLTRESRAFENMRDAIDMHEIFENVSIRGHKSFFLDGGISKVSRDILKVGDEWTVNLSLLELQNAATKRVASSIGSKRVVFSSKSYQREPVRGESEGRAKMAKTKGYSKMIMALSTLKNFLATQQLRTGKGRSQSDPEFASLH
eukprot:3294016-Pleurochrysis_carterae.AAC.4